MERLVTQLKAEASLHTPKRFAPYASEGGDRIYSSDPAGGLREKMENCLPRACFAAPWAIIERLLRRLEDVLLAEMWGMTRPAGKTY